MRQEAINSMVKQNDTQKMLQSKGTYNFSADVIRVLAICGVVLIHTANAVYGRPDFFGGISWWVAIVLNSLSRISIPLFIMLSGYFLLNKNESFTQSLKRTGNRIVIPLLFWFTADIIWNGGKPSFTNLNQSMIARLLTVNVFDLYFLIILVGLYVAAPILRVYLQKTNYSTQRNFTIFALVAGVFAYMSQYFFHICSTADSFTYWLPYTGLFVAGYFLGNNAKNIKSTKLLITYSSFLLITIGYSYLYYSLHNRGIHLLDSHDCLFSYYSDSYLSVNVVVMAISAFVLLIRLKFQSVNPFIRNLVFSIARTSLGIYVLHTYFLDILDSRLHLFDHIAPLWIYIFIKWFVIFTLSYVGTFMLIKIPLVKRVFGETK